MTTPKRVAIEVTASVKPEAVHSANGDMSFQLRIRVVTLAVLLLVFPRAALAQSVVGVLGIAEEVTPIEKGLQDSREVVVGGYVFRLGTLNGRQVAVGRSGAGKVNAAIVATLMIGQFNPSALLFSGTA